MLNVVCITGRLVADPTPRQAANGSDFCTFTIACDRDLKGPDGERGVDFIDCIAWNQTAKAIAAYWTKGRLICLSGRLQIRKYTAKDGTPRREAQIAVRQTWFADKKSDYPEQGAGYEPRNFANAFVEGPQGELELLEGPDDDIPF